VLKSSKLDKINKLSNWMTVTNKLVSEAAVKKIG